MNMLFLILTLAERARSKLNENAIGDVSNDLKAQAYLLIGQVERKSTRFFPLDASGSIFGKRIS